jgi:uncharacterized protein (TIGR02145 family)
MKKFYVFALMLSIIGTVFSCQEEYGEGSRTPQIRLITPSNGADYELQITPQVEFSWWTTTRGITDYILKLGTTQSLENAVAIDVNVNETPIALSAATLDATLQGFGIADGTRSALYWTVEPKDAAKEAKTEIRSLTVTRIDITSERLKTPVAGANILLSDNLSGSLPISWEAVANASSYEVIIAKDAGLTQVLFQQQNVSGTSLNLQEADVQALIEDASKGLKRYYWNQLYWNVRTTGGNFISNTPRTLFLSGRRIFVDVRGSETMTYKVAVIDNEHYKGIWMAQNLKTKLQLNGEPIPIRTDLNPNMPVVLEAPATHAGYSRYTDNGVMTPYENPGNGYYYYKSWIYDMNNLAPTGWKVPEKTDWERLWNAVNAAGNINVILDPTVYNNAAYGAWGLNMSAVGYYTTWPTIEFESGYDAGLNYMVNYLDDGGYWSSIYYAPDRNIDWNYNIIAVRLKYTGDGE